MMGDKYKKNLIFHANILVQHYYSFLLHKIKLQILIRTAK